MGTSKVIIITQARIGSSRLPAKILKKVNGKSLLAIHLQRLLRSRLADRVLVATTHEEGIEQVLNIAEEEGVDCFQGSMDDVLDRFYQAAQAHQPNYVVRVTSDCPLLDPQLIDAVIEMAIENDLDFCSNVLVEAFPDGQDVEVIKFSALEKAWKEAQLKSEREHVTPYIRTHCDFNNGELFNAANYPSAVNNNHIRMTVDEQADFEAIEHLIDQLGVDEPWQTYTDYIIEHPTVFSNQKTIRNEGYIKSVENEKKE